MLNVQNALQLIKSQIIKNKNTLFLGIIIILIKINIPLILIK